MFEVGTKVVDRDGFEGVIQSVTNFEGCVWFGVRFSTGVAVRYAAELQVRA